VPQFQIKTYEQLAAAKIASVIANTNLSDITDSASVRQVLAAASMDDAEIYKNMSLLLTLFDIYSATGEDLDERAKDILPAIISRNESAKATGAVVFSRAGTTGTIIIGVGTKVKTAGGVSFVTTTQVTITPTSPEQIAGHGIGRDSTPAAIIADEGGVDGNVDSSAIVSFAAKPVGVAEVTNPDPTLSGADEETDDSFRERIVSHVATLSKGTPGAIEGALLGAQDPVTTAIVKFAKVIERPDEPGKATVYIDDGTGTALDTEVVVGEAIITATGGEERVFLDNWAIVDGLTTITSSARGALTEGTHYVINLATGELIFAPLLAAAEAITGDYTHYIGLIREAQKVVNGDSADRANYPGYASAGDYVRVLTPQVLLQNIVGALTVGEGFDRATVLVEASDSAKNYINGLNIATHVIRAEIISALMEVDGVTNVALTRPAADQYIYDHQLARTTEANVDLS